MEVELKSRTDKHIARRIWHLLGVLMILAIYVSAPGGWAVLIAAGAALGFIGFDLVRLGSPRINRWVCTVLGPVMRDSEINRPAGTSYLLAGVLTLVLLFPPQIIMLSLIFLAFADPAASYFGVRFGSHKLLGKKSYEGSFAAFVACFLTSIIFFIHQSLFQDNLILISLLAGGVGAMAELIPIGKLDDNFSLPILSAIGLSLLFGFFGGVQ